MASLRSLKRPSLWILPGRSVSAARPMLVISLYQTLHEMLLEEEEDAEKAEEEEEEEEDCPEFQALPELSSELRGVRMRACLGVTMATPPPPTTSTTAGV